jgi:hypothetical protein
MIVDDFDLVALQTEQLVVPAPQGNQSLDDLFGLGRCQLLHGQLQRAASNGDSWEGVDERR